MSGLGEKEAGRGVGFGKQGKLSRNTRGLRRAQRGSLQDTEGFPYARSAGLRVEELENMLEELRGPSSGSNVEILSSA